MESIEVKKFITETGFKTLAEIKEHFKDVDPALVKVHLEYLLTRRTVKQISFSLENETKELYYIPGR